MRVSVLLPAWNREDFVAESIRSVLAQTSAADEIIAVDDGSTDGTRAVLESFGDSVRVLTQPNRGVGAALNAAAAAAKGDGLAFIDSDDLWTADKLHLQRNALVEDGTLDGVFGQMTNFGSSAVAGGRSGESAPVPGLVKGTLLIRTEAFRRLGPFDEGRRAADFVDWFARANGRGFRWRMLSETVYRRRIHPGNMGRVDRARQEQDYLLTIKAFLDRRRAGE